MRWPGPDASTADDDLRRYWFVMTRAGWEKWEAGRAALDPYLEPPD